MLIAKLDKEYQLALKGRLHHQIDSINDSVIVDSTRLVESLSEDSLVSFFNALFGIDSVLIQANKFSMDSKGNLITPYVYTQIDVFDIEELIGSLVDDSKKIDSLPVLFETLFGIEIKGIPPNRFSILKDNSVMVNDIKEKQILEGE